MKTSDAINYFGSSTKLALALDLSGRQAVHYWGEYPPIPRQYQIEVLTNGELRAERSEQLQAA